MPRASRIPTLSGKEMVILELLLEDHEMYGLELVGASRRRLKRGTVYVTLQRMEEKGYVQSRLDAPPDRSTPGLPRRLYKATAAGRRLYDLLTMVHAKLRLEPA
jgi:PadR family transcriptional regulator, regulatory protein PadR